MDMHCGGGRDPAVSTAWSTCRRRTLGGSLCWWFHAECVLLVSRVGRKENANGLVSQSEASADRGRCRAIESVVGEILRVLSRRLVQKALFVTNDDGLAPALAAAGVRVQASSVLSEADVADMLRRSRLRHAISPDDDALLGRLGRR